MSITCSGNCAYFFVMHPDKAGNYEVLPDITKSGRPVYKRTTTFTGTSGPITVTMYLFFQQPSSWYVEEDYKASIGPIMGLGGTLSQCPADVGSWRWWNGFDGWQESGGIDVSCVIT